MKKLKKPTVTKCSLFRIYQIFFSRIVLIFCSQNVQVQEQLEGEILCVVDLNSRLQQPGIVKEIFEDGTFVLNYILVKGNVSKIGKITSKVKRNREFMNSSYNSITSDNWKSIAIK